MAENKSNTFAEMHEKDNAQAPVAVKKSVVEEMTMDDFSSRPIGEKVVYNRPDLNGKEDIVDRFQVFKADASVEPKVSQDGKVKYWPVRITVTYSSLNEDKIQNREALSGARSFMNKDGTPSDIQFYYEGADNQVSRLWTLVAEAKGIGVDELSPREFVAFMNNKPKVLLEKKKFKNFNAEKGAPAFIEKNMIAKFI